MIRYLFVGVAALAAATAPAAAATFTVGTGTDQALIPANNFKANLEGLSLDNLRNFASLTLDGPAKIKVELFGSESGADDRLTITGGTPTSPFVHTQSPDVGFGPVLLATLRFDDPTTFNIQFSSSLSGFSTAHAPGSGEFGYFLSSADNGSAVTSNVLWLGYDNQLTATDDDNHDDFVLRLTASAVPEPAAWALMIGGFGIVGGALRRRSSNLVLA